MRRTLLTALLAMFMVGCAARLPIVTTPEKSASAAMRGSIVRMAQMYYSQEASVCTAFSVAPRKFLTAAHCVEDIIDPHVGKLDTTIKLGLMQGHVVKVDSFKDLAIVIANLSLPPVTFSNVDLVWDEPVMAIGYAHSFTTPCVTRHHVMKNRYSIRDWINPGVLYSGEFIKGMSGGPVYNINGMVVGIVQLKDDEVGFGQDATTILEFIKD